MILLMRCATGEDWNLIMYELANTEGYGGVKCIEQDFLYSSILQQWPH